MRRMTHRSLLLAAAALAVAALAIVPSATAQGPPTLDLTVSAPTAPLIPEAQIGQLSATATYSYSNPLQVGGAVGNQAITITFAITCPSTVLIVGPTTKIMSLAPQSSQTGGEVDADFQISITRQAPGLQSIQCQITASAPALQNPAIPAPDDASQTFILTADYYSLISAQVSGSKIRQAGPQKNVNFPIDITNFGNARTQITFELGGEPGGKRWESVLPEPIILDSPNTGGEGRTQQTATFTVATTYKNGWNNEQGSFQVLMKPTSADQADKVGNPQSASMLVRVRGVYVPGLEPVVLLGAILGSALVLRLRREE